MERIIGNITDQSGQILRYSIKVACVYVWAILSAILIATAPLLAQTAYPGIKVDGGENSFAFLVFNKDYSKGINLVVNSDENKKGMLDLLAGLAIPSGNILILEDPSKSDLEDAVYEFSRKLNRKSDLLVYYNGHSVNFLDAEQNEILLSSFKLPRSNDLFLLERRVSRSSVGLDTLISDFIPKRIGQVTVLYDACNAHFVPRDNEPEHWKVFNRAACLTNKVDGAEVFYAGSQIGSESLVNSLSAILSKNPTLDLLGLEKALAEYTADDAAARGSDYQEPVLVAGSRSRELSEICLRRSLDNGELVCNAQPAKAVKAVKAATVEEETVTASTETSTVKSTDKKAPKKKSMRDDWAAAKRAGRCKPYQEFVENYPNAVFTAKAKRAVENLCGPIEPEATSKEIAKKIPAKKKNSMRDDWAAAKRAGQCKPYQEFVKNYPNVVFTAKAKRAAENLCGTSEPEVKVVTADPVKVETESAATTETPAKLPKKKKRSMSGDWSAAKRAGRCKPYQEFVEKYPNSPFKVKADRAVEILCGVTKKKVAVSEPKKQEPEVQVSEVPEVEKTEVMPEPEKPVKEVVVAKIEPKPAKKKNAFGGWRAASRLNTCDAYLGFLADYPKSLFDRKAKKGAALKCSDADRAAFVAKAKEVKQPKKEVVIIETPKVPEPIIKKVPEVVYIANSKVNVRKGPGREHPKLDALPKNQEVTVYESTELANGELWFTLKRGNSSGYVPAKLFTKAKKPTVVKTPAKEPKGNQPPLPYAGVSADAMKNNYAFVVVNQKYKDKLEPILNSDADKSAMLGIIEGLKYPKENVQILLDPTKEELEDAAFEFALNMKPDADLLFYYSGYSISSLDDKLNFIVPVDFSPPSNKQVRINRRRFKENTVNVSALIRDLNEGRPRQLTVIYNACSQQGLPADKLAPYWVFLKQIPCSPLEVKDASILYPAKTKQLSLNSLGKNDKDKRSLFMRVLEKTIAENPSIDIKVMQQKLAWSVSALANRRKSKPREQDPVLLDGYTLDSKNPLKRCLAKVEVNGSLACTGMEGAPKPAVEEKVEVVVDPVAAEETKPLDSVAWNTAKRLNTCESYQDFKKLFSDSLFASKADARIKAVCVEASDPTIVLSTFCAAPVGTQTELGLSKAGYKQMQTELNRVKCNVGGADGSWGRNSQAGYNRFVKLAKIGKSGIKPTCAVLDQIQALPTKRICPLICGKSFTKINGRCVRNKPVEVAVPTTTVAPVATKEPTLLERVIGKKPKENEAALNETVAPKTTAKVTPTKTTAPKKVEPPKTVKVEVPAKTCAKGYVLKKGRCQPKKGFGFK